jgi:hypothetical protein
VNVGGALSLLASIKRGHRGEGRRVHPNGPCEQSSLQTPEANGGIAPFVAPPQGTRFRLRLNDAITALWAILLLSIVAYALIEGEEALAELDGLDLVAAYSLAP